MCYLYIPTSIYGKKDTDRRNINLKYRKTTTVHSNPNKQCCVGVLFLFICACFNCLRRSVSCMSKCCPSL